jgi:hypothetical protein
LLVISPMTGIEMVRRWREWGRAARKSPREEEMTRAKEQPCRDHPPGSGVI